MKRWPFITVCLCLTATAAVADSWFPPRPQTFSSREGTYRLTIFPREFTGTFAFFSDKVEGKSPAAQTPGGQTRCEATLERLEGNQYRVLWRKALINDVSPLEALVSDKDGAFITFDNWHFKGMGDDTVVVYGGDGELRKQLSLGAILTPREFERLPRSVSSIWWSGPHQLAYDEETVEIKIVKNANMDRRAFFTRRLSLRTGQVLK